jgi:hypothetical protein
MSDFCFQFSVLRLLAFELCLRYIVLDTIQTNIGVGE